MSKNQPPKSQPSEGATDDPAATASPDEAAGKAAANEASAGASSDEAASSAAESEQGAEQQRADLDALRAERDEMNDRLLRQMAEFQNYRRRTEEDKSRLTASTKADVLRPMLGVLDDFERTVEAAEQFDALDDAEAAYTSLREGVALVLSKMQGELAKLGVEPIEAKGEPFSEREHEALMQQPPPEGVAPGTVLEEVQRGYRMDDRVLRHSRVVVAQ